MPPLDIDSAYTVTPEHVAFYRNHGFIKLKDVVGPAEIKYYGREISRMVQELNTMDVPLEQRSTYGKAFIQISNIWTRSAIVKEFVFGRRVARIAAELLEVAGVRLYHDQALYKEPGGGITPWHADQYYWPVASDRTVTAWIPLQKTPLEMGPLQLCSGTQNMKFGRDLEISDESERKLGDVLKDSPLTNEPYDLGEVSFHAGWTFHRAGANQSDQAREVMTIIYMDEDMRLSDPQNKNQINDWHVWCHGAKVGEVIDTPTNPVLWSSR